MMLKRKENCEMLVMSENVEKYGLRLLSSQISLERHVSTSKWCVLIKLIVIHH